MSIIVIGGSAIALYGVPLGTVDIDLLERTTISLEQALVAARVGTGLNIPVLPALVADVPWEADSRLQREAGAWTKLTVFKLEPHDLALSKAVRGDERDLAAIEALHRVVDLDREILITRYLDEMGHAIGDPAIRDIRFLLMIERVYGEIEAERADKRISLRRQPAG